MQNRKQLNGNI